MASVTASQPQKVATDPAPAERPPGRRRTRRFRRRLRTRIILSFLLLGTGLTALFAFLTDYARQRVESQLVEDVMNRNIDEYARRFYVDPTRNPDLPVQQMRGRVVRSADFEQLREMQPDWYELPNGNHNITGVDENGEPFAYKLAVRKTPNEWFFLAYDMTQTLRGEAQLKRALFASLVLFSGLSLLIGWWSASRVMRPVTELAARLRAYRGSSQPKKLAGHFPDDEVGQLAEALDDYASRLTEVVQRDREFNADVSHELRTPLAVIKGAVELLLSRPDLDERTRARLLRIQRAEQQCSDLIGSLLLLSRNERGQGRSDVAVVAEQLLESHRAQLGGKSLALRLEGSEGDLGVEAPEAALSGALGNLIGNAVKYTPSGEVLVRLVDGGVQVIDTGPGLSAEDADGLFRRGYRGTHAGHSQGAGIGLSIVSRLCDLYGWKVSVRPREDGEHGVVATLAFGGRGIAAPRAG
ncbi:sensor histidine kinase [Pseudoxanthomonas suwonensis]|uniref:sensor histidine kinase n=1 Tax=Pseudoxanthomonas suwonensis TaxID=314722 RepID=UPI001FE5A900|nr:HAMP domain-containing sensor histidine kinase [Pseudoxanthomonas suwonensis]